MNDWGQQDEQSKLEYRNNGLSNVYNAGRDTEAPEFYTIYNPNASKSSRLISLAAIFAVIVFFGVLFYFLFQDRSESPTTFNAAATVRIKA